MKTRSYVLLIALLLIAVHVSIGFPTTDHHSSLCCKQCLVCETTCKLVDCPMEPDTECNCPDGFTFNGKACMQDYSSKICVQPLCCCECRKHC
uniref:TIL domain-containing protein n=1 Tax=Anopheles merus TaxID=30066 RepID=A0A1I8JVC7_ANOME